MTIQKLCIINLLVNSILLFILYPTILKTENCSFSVAYPSAPTNSLYRKLKSTFSPTRESSTCSDINEWYDSQGRFYNCEWYSKHPSRCDSYGDLRHNFGYTAIRACCVCGGGVYHSVSSAFDEFISTCAKIQVKATNEFLHLDGLGDNLLSTQFHSDDDFQNFVFVKQQNEASYRILVKASGLYLVQEDNNLLSTRETYDKEEDEDDDFTKFFLEFQDNDETYKIRVKANGRYWYGEESDKLVTTVSQPEEDGFVRFSLIPC